MNIKEFLSLLSADHQLALSWFEQNAGKDGIPFTPIYEGIQIVSPAQGIYKPASSEYVLSVKETLNGKYPDQEPVEQPDGSWLYAYHQQGDDSEFERDKLSTNRAFMKNIEDQVPVGVWRQTQSKGRKGTQYKIGIALPIGWSEGFFLLVGAAPDGNFTIPTETPGELLAKILKENQEQVVESEDFFNPADVVDERKKALRTIVQRQGQPEFRRKLLHAYESTCPITGFDVEQALEAAHIFPYLGPTTNSVQNGLPLRSDIHTLWDLGYICVDTSNMTVLIHPTLQSSEYGRYHEISLCVPNNVNDVPSKAALEAHRKFCGF
jgi:putative restriction endonuclease